MEKRELSISFSRSGAGNFSPKITLPKKWIDEMKITQEDRKVEVFFNENTKEITIKKK